MNNDDEYQCSRCNENNFSYLLNGRYFCTRCHGLYIMYLKNLEDYYLDIHQIITVCINKGYSVLEMDFILSTVIKPIFDEKPK